MRKKILILIQLYLFCIPIFAQSNAICVYKVEIIKNGIIINDSDDATTINSKNLIKDAVKMAENFEYFLNFNKNESIFKINEVLEFDGKSNYLFPIAKAVIGSGIYYQNKIDNESLHQFEVFGNDFLVSELLINDDWEITPETKKIGKFTCYKAIKNCETCNSSNFVWFTPEIPYPYGPVGYGGLPGLILEIKMKTFTLRLDNIQYKKNVSIVKPIRGEKVTLEEYRKISSEMRSKIKE